MSFTNSVIPDHRDELVGRDALEAHGSPDDVAEGGRDISVGHGRRRWVAEQPELHLLPHIEAWCQQDPRLVLTSADTDSAHAYVLDFEWRGEKGSLGAARAAAFSLIGSFAESATYVRQRRVTSDGNGTELGLQFEVGTGELAPDARFEPHGHVALISVVGVL
jgi:hypothetical protein